MPHPSMKLRTEVSRFRRRRLIRILGGIVVAYIGLCLLLWAGQTRLIFHPDSRIKATPASVGLSHQDVRISVGNATVHGWWIPAAQPAPTILSFYGNGSNLGDRVNFAAQLHHSGWSVFLIDYRGYGLSSGSFPSEQSVYQDAIAALNYLTQTRQIPPESIVVMGESLGGAIALEVAYRHPEIAGVVVESSFTSMREMIDFVMPFRFLPFDLIPFDQLLNQRFDSISKVRSLQVPILLIHGTADDVVPPEMSQALYKATPPPKELLLIPGADHENVRELGELQYFQALQKFVERYATLPSESTGVNP